MVSRRVGQQDSEACDDSVKPGVAAEKQESDPKQTARPCCRLRVQTVHFLEFPRTVTACIISSSHFFSTSEFRAPGKWLGVNKPFASLVVLTGGYRQRGEVWIAEPYTWRERGLSFIPALSLKLHSQLWITIHPELNPQLRTHRERQKMQFNVYLSI